MKLLVLAFILVLLSHYAKAQIEYVFESTPVKFPKVDECPQNDYLSKDVRIKLEQFNLVYTKKVEIGAPQFISSIEIIKPDVYYSIQKLSKYYCKCLKKGIISQAAVEDELAAILDKCFQIFEKDTKPIEAELRATNNPEDIVNVFDKIVIRQQ